MLRAVKAEPVGFCPPFDLLDCERDGLLRCEAIGLTVELSCIIESLIELT